jgi:flagellar export protein FliJ
MTRSDRMKSIARLAKANEQDAASLLARSNRELSMHEQKLLELRRFRSEYGNLLAAPDGGTLSVASMRQIKSFLQQLDHAIAQLELQHTLKQQANDRDKEKWIGTRHRVDALDAVVDKYKALERKAADLKLELELDDLVQRRVRPGGNVD